MRRGGLLDHGGGGRWKGEVTNQEHSPTFGERPVWERKVVTIGFTGTVRSPRSDGMRWPD